MGASLDVGNATLGAELFATLQAIVVLALVVAVAWTVRRVLRQARRTRGTEQLAIEERLSLDLRNALVIVRVAERRLLLATSDHGPARLVAELRAEPTPTMQATRAPLNERTPE